MNKAEIYKLLTEKNIQYEKAEHTAVYNMSELASVGLTHPACEAKNIFIRDDKKHNYYLITVRGEKRVDLKDFRKKHGLRPISFASEKELSDILGVTTGAVSPFGLLNDEERKVKFFLDDSFFGKNIAVHPNDNTATVWLPANDLMSLLREHGNVAEFAGL